MSRLKNVGRVLAGITVGGGTGYVASMIAGSAGSQCTILCNQAVAIPFFAAMGLLFAWR